MLLGHAVSISMQVCSASLGRGCAAICLGPTRQFGVNSPRAYPPLQIGFVSNHTHDPARPPAATKIISRRDAEAQRAQDGR
jgi:hypothetical protein